MRDALKAYLSLASGLTEVTRQRALAAAKALVSQGEATAEQVSTLAEDLVAQTKANREAVSALVKFEVDRGLGRVGLASSDEVGELAGRVRALEAELRDLRLAVQGGRGTPAATEAAPAESVPAKAAPARPAAKAAPAKAKAAPTKAQPAKTGPAETGPATTGPATTGPAGSPAGSGDATGA